MDITTCWFNDAETIDRLIAETERKYPSRKQENDEWRKWLSICGNEEKLKKAYPGIDINAGFISDCRSDSLCCGACLLRRAIRELRETPTKTDFNNKWAAKC